MAKKDFSEKKNDSFGELKLNPRYKFDQFIVGLNNRFVHSAALAVAENIGKTYNPFFIYGGVGLGKTHLMQAIGHYAKDKYPGNKIFYVTSEKFTSEVIEAIRKGEIQSFRDRYRALDLLLVDDVQFLVESESTQEEFFHTFNILYENGKQIVLTSDRPPKQLTLLEDRLRSRFEWGLIADIKPPNLETRVAILKKKSEGENIEISEEILKFIATKLVSNIRELEGFLKRLFAFAKISQQEINIDLAKELMIELVPEEGVTTTPALQPVVAQPQPAVIQPPPPTAKKFTPPKIVPAETTPETVNSQGMPVEVVFFYPEDKSMELKTLKNIFNEVIKKHKLKFRLESVFEKGYDPMSKISYAFFTELCKTNKVNIAVVLGPPPDSLLLEEEFSLHLADLMETEKIFFLFIPYKELNREHRYLNLALDITLIKHRVAK